MKRKSLKSQKSADAPVHLVGLMLLFSNVVADMKRMTGSMELFTKKLTRAMRNGTVGHGKPKRSTHHA